MRSRNGIISIVAGGLCLVASAAFAADPVVTVGNGSADAGGTANVTVSLNSGGQSLAGVQNVVGYDPNAPIAHVAVASTLAQAAGVNDTLITVASGTAFPDIGMITIGSESISYGKKAGNELYVGGCSKSSNQGAPLACKDNSQCPGGTCDPVGRAQGGTTAAAHASGAAVSLEGEGSPDCTRNAALTDTVAAFTFTNVACYTAPGPRDPSYVCPCNLNGTEPACDGVAAVVLKTNNLETGIPTGALYTCKVTLPDAPENTTFALPCPAAASSAGDGTPIATNCTAGQVKVSSCCPGDADQNGFVNLNDYKSVRDNFGKPGPAGDADCNSFVNLNDYKTVRDNFGKNCQ